MQESVCVWNFVRSKLFLFSCVPMFLFELCWCKNQFAFDIFRAFQYFYFLLSCVGARISLCLENLVRSNVFILLLSCVGARISLCLIYFVRSNVLFSC